MCIRSCHPVGSGVESEFQKLSPYRAVSVSCSCPIRVFIMARTKKTQPGWNAKFADTDAQLNSEIENARNNAVRPNLRTRMATLQDLPMATTAISFDGSLDDWLDRCLSPVPSSAPLTDPSISTAVIRRDPSKETPAVSVRILRPYFAFLMAPFCSFASLFL